MQRGRVKWFHRKKGYGFVVDDKGQDIFVHFSTIEGEGFRYLEDGQEVEFEAQESGKGLKASKVVKMAKEK
jgi:CspA family cold shock protein